MHPLRGEIDNQILDFTEVCALGILDVLADQLAGAHIGRGLLRLGFLPGHLAALFSGQAGQMQTEGEDACR